MRGWRGSFGVTGGWVGVVLGLVVACVQEGATRCVGDIRD